MSVGVHPGASTGRGAVAAQRAVRVLLHSRTPLVVAGLQRMLGGHLDRVRLIGRVAPGAVPASYDERADVVVYDVIASRGADAEDVVPLLGRTGAHCVLYGLGGAHRLRPAAHRLVADGALYLSAADSGETLLRTVEAAAALGGQREPDWITTNPTPDDDWPGRERGLSMREAQVLALIARGLTNQQIAARTYLSINSVKTYIRTGYRKIGVETRSQAVAWGIRESLAPGLGPARG